MGLDMYLSKKTYLKNWEHDKENNYSVIARNNGKKISHIQKSRVSYVIEEIAYWRKDNHIHNWFVTNCQNGEDDCRDAYVSREQLEELIQLCKQVKDYLDTCEKEVETHEDFFTKQPFEYYKFKVDENVMKKCLPTVSGFFFGGTDYDKWYYQSLENTIQMIKEGFKNIDIDDYNVEFSYSSSW